MLFQASILKKTSNGQKQINFLIDNLSEENIRSYLGKRKLIILALQSYGLPKDSFGNIEIIVQDEKGTFSIVTNFEDLDKAISVFLRLGFGVTSGNYITNSLPAIEANNIVRNAILNIQSEQKLIAEQTSTGEQKLDDEQLKKLQEITKSTILDIDELITKTQEFSSSSDIMMLKSYAEDLKKIRMGTNTNKMSEILEEIFTLMEKIDLHYLEQQKSQEELIIQTSLVSNLDVLAEFDKYQKALKLKEAGASQSFTDRYYTILGKWAIYTNFLRKDSTQLFNGSGFSQKLYEFIYYLVVFLIIQTGVMLAFIYNTSVAQKLEYLWFIVLLGIVATLLQIGKLFNPKSIISVVIIVGLIGLLSGFGLYQLKLYFN